MLCFPKQSAEEVLLLPDEVSASVQTQVARDCLQGWPWQCVETGETDVGSPSTITHPPEGQTEVLPGAGCSERGGRRH